MKGMLKRCGSLLLVLVMVLTMLPVSVMAADASVPTVTVKTDAITDGERGADNIDSNKTNVINKKFAVGDEFYVPITVSGLESFDGVGLQLTYDAAVLTFLTAVASFEYYDETEYEMKTYGRTLLSTTGTAMQVNESLGIVTGGNGNNPIAVNTQGIFSGYLFFAKFKVVGYSEDGMETIGIKSSSDYVTGVVLNTQDIEGLTYVAGEVEVETNPDSGSDIPAVPAGSDFELYYTLDKSTDTEDTPDNYIEYGTGDTVTATIYLKSSKAWTLQGYDIFVEKDALLTATVSDADWIQDGDDTAEKGAVITNSDTLVRIQYIGNQLQYALTANEPVAIAKITYVINGDAVYGDDLDIKLADESAIAAEGTSLGLQPALGATPKGVEVNTKYDVTFNSNGGSTVTGFEVGHGLTFEAPSVPTKQGYTFAGWYADAALETAWNFDEDTVSEDITLYAKWTAGIVNYTVKHLQQNITDDNYTEVEADRETKTGTTGTQTAAEAKTYTGFNAGAVTQTTIKADGTTVVEIKYDRKTYSITFDSNGGSNVAGQTIRYGGKVTQPEAPKLTGYGFAGWYADAALETAWNFDEDTVSEDITLYAKWEQNQYTVTFVADGKTYATANVTHGGIVDKPESDPSKLGYTFGGWYKEESLTNVWNFSTDTVTANTTIYAKLTINTYNITYNFNDGTYDGDYTKTYTVETDDITLITPTKTGYSFAGWYKDANFSGDAVTKITKGSTGDKEFHAKWEAAEVTYTVKHMQQNVSGEGYTQESVETLKGLTGAQTAAEAKTYTGFTAQTFEQKTITADGNTIVEIYYNRNEITVTIDTANGSDATTVTVLYGATIAEPEQPTRAGYTFVEWQVNDSAYNFSTPVTAPITLTATWVVSYKLEAYAYAKGTDALLIVDASGIGADKAYAVKIGDTTYEMYFSDDVNYRAKFGNDCTGVYLYIVTPDSVVENGNVAIMSADKLSVVNKTLANLDKNGDVNGNGRIDIGDANAVYQMLRAGGGYYSDISVLGRLIADMVTESDPTNYRGDVNDAIAIVNILNGIH